MLLTATIDERPFSFPQEKLYQGFEKHRTYSYPIQNLLLDVRTYSYYRESTNNFEIVRREMETNLTK